MNSGVFIDVASVNEIPKGQGSAFDREYRVLTPDLRGFGFSGLALRAAEAWEEFNSRRRFAQLTSHP